MSKKSEDDFFYLLLECSMIKWIIFFVIIYGSFNYCGHIEALILILLIFGGYALDISNLKSTGLGRVWTRDPSANWPARYRCTTQTDKLRILI